MGIPETIQSALIFWWYAVDDHGHIAMVNSNACKTPRDLPDSIEQIESIGDFVDTLPVSSYTTIPNANIDQFIKFDRKILRIRYMEGFAWSAELGFFVYDKTPPEEFESATYHQVHAPQIPLKISDIPKEFSDLMKRVAIPVDFRSALSIDISALL
jgi:hypothetical protein